jgi:hypothetical protein
VEWKAGEKTRIKDKVFSNLKLQNDATYVYLIPYIIETIARNPQMKIELSLKLGIVIKSLVFTGTSVPTEQEILSIIGFRVHSLHLLSAAAAIWAPVFKVMSYDRANRRTKDGCIASVDALFPDFRVICNKNYGFKSSGWVEVYNWAVPCPN